jgi:hypothetical protein
LENPIFFSSPPISIKPSRAAPAPTPKRGVCGGCVWKTHTFSNVFVFKKFMDLHPHPPTHRGGQERVAEDEKSRKMRENRCLSFNTFSLRRRRKVHACGDNVPPYRFSKQESVGSWLLKKNGAGSDWPAPSFFQSPFSKRRFSTWIFIPIRLHWIT